MRNPNPVLNPKQGNRWRHDKKMMLNAFEMMVPAFQSPGLWRHPEDQSHRYTELDYWVDLAQTLESGGFAGIFLADILGVYDSYGGSGAAAWRGGGQYAIIDRE